MNWDDYFPAVRAKIIDAHIVQVVDLYNRLVEMNFMLLQDQRGWDYSFSAIRCLNQGDYLSALCFAQQAVEVDPNWKFVEHAAKSCVDLMKPESA